MRALGASDAASADNPANYLLTTRRPDGTFRSSQAVYDNASRTVTLSSNRCAAGTYDLSVRTTVRSGMGLSLQAAVGSEFTVMADVTAGLAPSFSGTRFDRAADTIRFEVTVTNHLGFAVQAPTA